MRSMVEGHHRYFRSRIADFYQSHNDRLDIFKYRPCRNARRSDAARFEEC